ncbi:MAG: rhamnulokinase [Ardenticatenaceae bacterium]|nr:rhamnulokinase [Ardenticatenaceae bacterium]MCB8991136.1 rhamnulokinase [Ardenticatenaceae bacterium]MCB9005292.1 rhamnulokinase [Ardenticatenaceae bacterium]
MTTTTNFLAFDLGAESGRAILGRFDGERLALTEAHRFANVPVRLPDGLHWDVLRLWHEIQQGLTLTQQQAELAGIGLDTWGVDFALLDKAGTLLGNPFHYRDGRTDTMLDEAFRRAGKQAIFDHTGIQFMSINTLYQLLSMVVADSPAMEMAHTFLTIPDLFNYWLTGRKVSEFTIATTTQCYDPLQGNWATSLLTQLGIPSHIFPEIVPPGTVLGDLRAEWGVPVPVIAPACHDTGSAVTAVPAVGERFAWISSGTWSIMGAEVERAVIDGRSLTANMTNEGGVNGTFRFSRNIMGLWLVQECRRAWAQQGDDFTYEALTQMAAAAPPLAAVIDPDDADFLKPGDMPARIQAYCQRTGQAVPESRGAIVRCALESLALKYRWVLDQLETILGYQLDPIHIIGGGTQNKLLNQFTADATGRQVITGPVEATAVGNVLVQAMALGHIGSLAEGRALVRRSFAVDVYEPAVDRKMGDEGYGRLLKLLKED